MATLETPRCRTEASTGSQIPGPRVALLTPYSGGNLGDAAIQDSMILNLRVRLPNVCFLGITLNCENFLNQHGVSAFPMLASLLTQRGQAEQDDNDGEKYSGPVLGKSQAARTGLLRGLVRRIPGIRPIFRSLRSGLNTLRREKAHWVEGYRVLRTQDILLLSGGGQLDEEYGGAWRLPYTYFKWTLIARLARVPCAMVSVGAGKIESLGSRLFISSALRMCCYRSFRESRSKATAVRLYRGAKKDEVIPDLAFSLPECAIPAPAGTIRSMARGRAVIALSPIAYAKPVNWPTSDRDIYRNYIRQLARVMSRLSEEDCFLVVVCSSLGDDESVIPDILAQLDSSARDRLDEQTYYPSVKSWREFVAVLQEVDCLIASRLHGTILSFVSQTPAVAISFDPKVDWVMEDLDQSNYLLHIRNFTAEDVLSALQRMKEERGEALLQICSFRRGVLAGSESARQFDFLAELALSQYRSRA